MKLSFLASHNGSAARQIIGAMRAGSLAAECALVITNNRDAAIFHWCAAHEVEILHISGRTHEDETARDHAIMRALQRVDTDLVVLSGYMKKIGPQTLAAYSGRILNIHPSLLPRHGGAGLYGDRVHAAVLAAGDRLSGATVHLLSEDYDTGRALRQATVPVFGTDTVASLRERVKAVEGALYIATLRDIIAAGVVTTRHAGIAARVADTAGPVD